MNEIPRGISPNLCARHGYTQSWDTHLYTKLSGVLDTIVSLLSRKPRYIESQDRRHFEAEILNMSHFIMMSFVYFPVLGDFSCQNIHKLKIIAK